MTFASLLFSQRYVFPRYDAGSLDNPFPTFRRNTVLLVPTVQASKITAYFEHDKKILDINCGLVMWGSVVVKALRY